MSEYVDVDIIENGKIIGTMKVLKKTEEPEEQNIKLNKIDDKTAYENLLIKYAELKEQVEKMKCCFNCKHSRTEYEHCRTDKHEKWEIKEK